MRRYLSDTDGARVEAAAVRFIRRHQLDVFDGSPEGFSRSDDLAAHLCGVDDKYLSRLWDRCWDRAVKEQ